MHTCPQLRKRRLRGLPFVLTRGVPPSPPSQSGRGMRARHLHFFCAVGRGKYTRRILSGNGERSDPFPPPAFLHPFLRLKRNESGNGSGWWRWFSFFFCFLFVSLDRGMFEDVELFPSSLFLFFLEFLPPSCLSRPDTREIKKPWSQRTLMLKILDHVTGYRIAFLDYRFFLISQQTKEFRRILDHIPSIVITILLLEWNLRYIKTVAKK